MRIERFCFPGAGGAQLAGVVRRPDGDVVGSALIAHCFTCGKDIHTTARLAKALTRAGWLTMTFDFTGIGDSGGSFSEKTVRTNVGDISRAAVALLERNAGPCLLIGHSLGGAAAVLAAARVKTADRVIAIAAPSDTEHVEHLWAGGRRHADGSVETSIGGRPFRVGAAFQADLAEHDVLGAAGEIDRPFLVVQAGADTIVGREQTERLAAAGDAELITIADADHLFSGAGAASALADQVLGWLERT
ncbi:MAG: alpha/beta fold hydrolase [Actinomycetota bacterium]